MWESIDVVGRAVVSPMHPETARAHPAQHFLQICSDWQFGDWAEPFRSGRRCLVNPNGMSFSGVGLVRSLSVRTGQIFECADGHCEGFGGLLSED